MQGRSHGQVWRAGGNKRSRAYSATCKGPDIQEDSEQCIQDSDVIGREVAKLWVCAFKSQRGEGRCSGAPRLAGQPAPPPHVRTPLTDQKPGFRTTTWFSCGVKSRTRRMGGA